MLQAKLSPRRETLLFSTDRTGSERSSLRYPSPASEEATASRATPRGLRRKAGQDREEFQVGGLSFAIYSPLGAQLTRSRRKGQGGRKL
jgi:hypothetical protein